MCGIFGIIGDTTCSKKDLQILVRRSRQRGRDSSGLVMIGNDHCKVTRADHDITKLVETIKPEQHKVICGHSRLITNGLLDNQPVVHQGIIVLHNGIVVNSAEIWKCIGKKPKLEIDTEVIAALAQTHLDEGGDLAELPDHILKHCEGVVCCCIMIPALGATVLFSNNGSLYHGDKGSTKFFASEKFTLEKLNCTSIRQINKEGLVLYSTDKIAEIKVQDDSSRLENLIPKFEYNRSEAGLLEYDSEIDLKRCTKCILPETMPFIHFDERGVCNYCKSYKLRNIPKPKNDLFALVEPYRRTNQQDCIVPFSGGRDSCYGLHLIVNELKMKPIAYTYDWGMVTDLGRRNISRMCSKLGVENIIIAADISKKRRNIKMNLEAWLHSPHLGMMAMLTAGDKHFFRYVETVKKQTKINLNLWGVNPLEVTHFKTGFLGIPPDFEEEKVYSNGVLKQLRYHFKRTGAMLESPKYFNRSLFDTLSGEYYRSFTKKHDYFHLFDYWTWDECEIDKTLLGEYDWEKAPDTSTTWRIGDGTAALYNYIYYTVAGFTEHDTFRSNQIREGQIDRQAALALVREENRPRYQNIRWYLDTLKMDFSTVINVINKIPKLYAHNQ